MKNVVSFDNFQINEAKSVNPKKGYTLSTKVQDSIKKLCEGVLHKEAKAAHENDDKSMTYDKCMKEAHNYMKECMNECGEVYKASAKSNTGSY